MSEYGDRGSGVGDRDRFDTAIDLAVREMLDVEPPSGLRGRVLDRIDTNSVASAFRRKDNFKRKFVWIAAPLAAAAILVLAVLLPSTSDRTPVAPATAPAADQRLAVTQPPPQAPQLSTAMRPPVATGQAASRPSRDREVISAAVVADPEFLGAQVEALAGPAPLAVAGLAGPPAPSVPTAGVAPIEIRALEVNAITETPRERREE